MNKRISMIRKGALIGALLALTSANAQDVFPLRSRWQIENETYAWGLLREDGIKDLAYYNVEERIGNRIYQEVAIRRASGEFIVSQLLEGFALPLIVFDFTGDGNDDIVTTVVWYPNVEPVRVYDGTNLNRVIEFRNPFDGNGGVFNGKLVNNDERVLIRKSDYWIHQNEDRMIDVSSFAAYLMLADRNTFELDTVVYAPLEGSLDVMYYENGDFDYFVYGEIDSSWFLPTETDTAYTTLLTSYGADIRNPRQLILAKENEDYQNRLNRSEWIIPPYSIVDDIDHDGTLDWVVGHYDESDVDTYTVYITKYNPANFEIQAEYSEHLPGWGEWAQGTAFIRGIHAVDVDRDGTSEILLAIPEHPIRILEPFDLNLIMVSDSSLDAPRTINPKKSEIGYFEENHYNLQIAHFISGEFVKVYDLPGEWYYPQSMEGVVTPSLPTSLSLSCAPNPFNSTLTIRYAGGLETAATRLGIYDVNGREVANLLGTTGVSAGRQGIHPAAEGRATVNKVTWDASASPAGVYFVRLQAGGDILTKKVVLMR